MITKPEPAREAIALLREVGTSAVTEQHLARMGAITADQLERLLDAGDLRATEAFNASVAQAFDTGGGIFGGAGAAGAESDLDPALAAHAAINSDTVVVLEVARTLGARASQQSQGKMQYVTLAIAITAVLISLASFVTPMIWKSDAQQSHSGATQ